MNKLYKKLIEELVALSYDWEGSAYDLEDVDRVYIPTEDLVVAVNDVIESLEGGLAKARDVKRFLSEHADGEASGWEQA